MLPEVFRELEAAYAALIEIDSLDAGFCARATAPLIAAAHKGYIIGLKGHQPELLREAERLLGARTQAEDRSDWEPYQGDQLRYHLVSHHRDGNLSGLEPSQTSVACGKRNSERKESPDRT